MTASLLFRLTDDHPLHEEDDYHWALQTHNSLLGELKMLLVSRARLPDIENIPLINTSVLNYGIDESFSKINEINSRRLVMENRLKNAIARFEPRLNHVLLTSNMDNIHNILFKIHGFYFTTPVELEITWNECNGIFYFNE